MSWRDTLPQLPEGAKRSGQTIGNRIGITLEGIKDTEANVNSMLELAWLLGLHIGTTNVERAREILLKFTENNFEHPRQVGLMLEVGRALIVEDILYSLSLINHEDTIVDVPMPDDLDGLSKHNHEGQDCDTDTLEEVA